MSLEDFDSAVRSAASKGKLSAALVDSVVRLTMENIASDAHLVSTFVRANKKAPPPNKLNSLYVLDAVCREAKSRAKKAGKEKKLESDPIQGVEATGTFASFLVKVELVLSKIVMDCWENGLLEHREKVRKVFDIWTKAGTFGSGALLRISTKLLNTAAPPPTPPPTASTSIDTSAIDIAGPSGIPANILALLKLQAAAGGPPPPPPPPPAQFGGSASSKFSEPAPLDLNPAQLASLQSLSDRVGQSATSNGPIRRDYDRPQDPRREEERRNSDFRRDPRDYDQGRGIDQGRGMESGRGMDNQRDWNGPPRDNFDDRRLSGGPRPGFAPEPMYDGGRSDRRSESWNGPPQSQNWSSNDRGPAKYNDSPPPNSSWDRPMSSGGMRPGGSRPEQGIDRSAERFGNPQRSQNREDDSNQSVAAAYGQRDSYGPPPIRAGPPNDYNRPNFNNNVPPNSNRRERTPDLAPTNDIKKRRFDQGPAATSYPPPANFPPPNFQPPPPSFSNTSAPPPNRGYIHPSRLSQQVERSDLDEFGREKRAIREEDGGPPKPLSPPRPTIYQSPPTESTNLIPSLPLPPTIPIIPIISNPPPPTISPSNEFNPSLPNPTPSNEFSNFNPCVEADWEAFGNHWKATYGILPTQEIMIKMVMERMQQVEMVMRGNQITDSESI